MFTSSEDAFDAFLMREKMIFSELKFESLAIWWTIVEIAGVGSKKPFEIWKACKGEFEKFSWDFEDLKYLKLAEEFRRSNAEERYSRLLKAIGTEVSLVVIDSEYYPKTLYDLDSPPLFLFIKGNLSALHNFSVGVVGTRRPDNEALRLVDHVVRDNSINQHTIISGGAIGIDTAAHEGALRYNAPTVVVSPSGIEALTPRSNLLLFEKIVKNEGLLLSEYLPFSKPRKYHFHRRNMLLAALSNEVVIVRATEKSGTMITAKAALKLNRPLFAVPGSPLDPLSQGCLSLLATGKADFYPFNKIDKKNRKQKDKMPEFSPIEKKIYELLGTPKTIDDLLLRMKDSSSAELLSTLTMMEMSGYIQPDSQVGGYRRT